MFKVKNSLETVFSKVLLFYIILVIFSTIVPQFVFMNFFKSSYNNEINQNSMQKVIQMKKTIDEQVLKEAISIPSTYLSDLPSNSDMTYALYNDISKDVKRIHNISERLNDIKNTVDFLDSIDLYYPKGNLVFIDNGVQFLNDISSDKMHEKERMEQIINAASNIDWIPSHKVNKYEPREIVSFVRRVPFNAPMEATNAVISVNINENVFNKYITDINTSNKGAILIVDGNGNVISKSDKSGILTGFENSEYAKEILSSDKDGIFQANLNGKLNVISYTKSTINNWRYISISSINDFYQKSYQLKNYLLAISIVLLLVNLLATVLFTRKIHEPINNLIKSFKSIALKFSSNDNYFGKNEYNYLNNMIINIESKVDELNERLEMNKPLIRNSILLKLLSGGISVHDSGSLLDLKFDKENLVCFVLKIYREIHLKLEDKMLVNYNLAEILDGEYDGYTINALIDDNGDVAGIVNYSFETKLSSIEYKIQEKIESLLNAKYIISLGNTYKVNTGEISHSYEEASLCMKYTYIKPDVKLLHYNDLSIEGLKETGSSPRILEKIEGFVRAADGENLRYTVNSIVESIKIGDYKIEFCKNTLNDMLTLIRMTIGSMGYNPDELFGYDIRDYFKNIQDINEFRSWITGIIDIYIEEANNKKQGLNDDLDIRIKKYIEDHLYTELSLDSTAEDLHMSVGHLSRIFKAKNGTTFSSYVTDIKLQNAVRLLHEGKLTVKEISIKLGYNSVQHFIKIFKEKYGHTPKEYQKITSQKN